MNELTAISENRMLNHCRTTTSYFYC